MPDVAVAAKLMTCTLPRILGAGLLSACTLLTACGSSGPGSSGAQAPVAAKDDPSAARTLTPAKATYEVTLKPETRQIEAAVMQKAYKGTNDKGALLFDAASAPEIAALKPGTVTIFAGRAVLKVDRVSNAGGTLAVTGTPAGLEDAIDHGHIAWSTALDFHKMAFTPPPGFHRVEPDHGPLYAALSVLASPAQAAFSLSDNSWTGKVEGFTITLKLTPVNNDMSIDLKSTKSIGGGTIEVHGVGKFNDLVNQTSITLANGATTEIEFDNTGVTGSVDFDWKVAFDADHGGKDPEMLKTAVVNLPFSLDFPIAVGPVPFKITLKAGYAFEPTFSSKVAVAQGSYHATFGGDMPMKETADGEPAASAATPPPAPAAPANANGNGNDGGGGDAGGSMTGGGEIRSHGGTVSMAQIGLSTTVAMPKIGLTMGLPSVLSSVLGSPDFGGPYATLMTQANFIATGTLTMVQCEKRVLNVLGFVGYKPGLLGKLKVKEKGPLTVLKKSFSEVTPPNITLCQ